MTTISDLPMDMVEQIFSKVPLQSMRAVRLTCKNWNSLSNNRSLHAAKEVNLNSNSRMIVLLMDYKLYLMSVVVNRDPYAEPQGKLTCLNDSEQVEISQIFQCEGLLLCILKDTLGLAVWNPYLGQRRWIEPRYTYRNPYGLDMYMYALGYSNKSHKILRFIDTYFSYGRNKGGEDFLWYEIYDLDTGLWKTLDFTSPHWYISSYQHGVSLKGNTYWIATERVLTEGLKDCIIRFDFTSESFGRLLPLPCIVRLHELVTLSCVRDEKLAALFQYHVDEASKVEIWITTKIDEEEEMLSWSKFLKVNMETITHVWINFCYGSFVIDEEKKLAMVFNKEKKSQSNKNSRHTMSIIGEDGYFRELDLGEDENCCCWTHACSYVPSLVQIKQRGGCERKKQTSLEERYTCDKKTSRIVAIQNLMRKS